MKLTDYVIIFVIITAPFTLIANFKSQKIEESIYRKIELNKIFDTAVVDGTNNLLDQVEGKKIKLNKEKALETFYHTLCVNFNMLDDPVSRSRISAYIPIILITEYDGFTIIGKERYIDEGGAEVIGDVIYPKVEYSYKKDHWIYFFTVGDQVRLINEETGEIITGSPIELKDKEAFKWLSDESLFQEIRRRTINKCIEKEVNDHIQHYNIIKEGLGISYDFYLPSAQNGNWSEHVDGYGMIAIIEGFPIGNTAYTMDCVSLGGARLQKSKKVYIQVDGATNLKYYHRDTCPLLIDKSQPVDNPKDGACKGAFPCEHCKP